MPSPFQPTNPLPPSELFFAAIGHSSGLGMLVKMQRDLLGEQPDLRAEDLLVFTAEALPDDDAAPTHLLQANGRHAHPRRRVQQTLAEAGWLVPATANTVVRAVVP